MNLKNIQKINIVFWGLLLSQQGHSCEIKLNGPTEAVHFELWSDNKMIAKEVDVSELVKVTLDLIEDGTCKKIETKSLAKCSFAQLGGAFEVKIGQTLVVRNYDLFMAKQYYENLVNDFYAQTLKQIDLKYGSDCEKLKDPMAKRQCLEDAAPEIESISNQFRGICEMRTSVGLDHCTLEGEYWNEKFTYAIKVGDALFARYFELPLAFKELESLQESINCKLPKALNCKIETEKKDAALYVGSKVWLRLPQANDLMPSLDLLVDKGICKY